MYAKILVPIDGSKPAYKALDHATDLIKSVSNEYENKNIVTQLTILFVNQLRSPVKLVIISSFSGSQIFSIRFIELNTMPPLRSGNILLMPFEFLSKVRICLPLCISLILSVPSRDVCGKYYIVSSSRFIQYNDDDNTKKQQQE